MALDLVGLGNALMDALVIVEDESWLNELGLARGVAHMVDHAIWQRAYDHVTHLPVELEAGGSCANTVSTAGLLGANTLFGGQVGQDQMGHLYAERMLACCNQHALTTTPALSTGKCLSVIGKHDAERTMITHLGASVSREALGELGPALSQCKIGHFEGYMLLSEGTQNLVRQGMAATRAGGGLVSLDVSDPFVVSTIRDTLWDLLANDVDVVFLNADEARALTDMDPDKAVVHIARQCKLHTVIVKLGMQGSIVSTQGQVVRVDAKPVHAIDTTGAGDAYAGGYLYGMIQKWEPARCGKLASHTASLTVSQIGAVAKSRGQLLDTLKVCAKAAPAA